MTLAEVLFHQAVDFGARMFAHPLTMFMSLMPQHDSMIMGSLLNTVQVVTPIILRKLEVTI